MALDVMLAEGLEHGIAAVAASPLTKDLVILGIIGLIAWKAGQAIFAKN